MNHYPMAVCTECGWEQFYHRGNERGAQNWGHRHSQDEGHAVRIKRQHEFADVLWAKEFIATGYGEVAVQAWLETLTDSTRELLDDYSAGTFSLEDCEVFYCATPA